MDIKIKLINGGTTPKKGREGDACFDCYANEVVFIPKGKTAKVPLGFALQLPKNHEAQIRPRSGLSSKGIMVQLGTGDENFTGEFSAIVYNSTDADFTVSPGDRICQLAIRPTTYESDTVQQFIEVDELEETNRGANGFGSSGMR